MRNSLLVLPLFLCSCAENLRPNLPPPAAGPTDMIPIAPTSGFARSWHWFGWKEAGDDTTEAAFKDAKQGQPELDILDPMVDRKVRCIPACDFALVAWTETSVTGTLARYKGVPEWHRPETAAKSKLDIGKAPPAQRLVERLEHLYGEDPKSAADFFASLSKSTRGEITDQVISGMGRISASGAFEIPKGASPERKKFLVWFVETYTTYQPLDE